MDLITLTQKLISIPSYVENNHDEQQIATFITDYLQTNTQLAVLQESVENGRCNVIAYNPTCINPSGELSVDTLFVNHIDTVQPRTGWNTDQFKAEIIDGKLYGLGAADTKGNVATLLKLAEVANNQKWMFLFYIDEEYDFKGMRQFVQDYQTKLKVKKIISADGENLRIRNAARGLVDLDLILIGKTGHSANPQNGISVVTAFSRLCAQLELQLATQPDPELGTSTMNVAYLRAGLNRGIADNQISLGKNGNNIPDYLEATVEFRINSLIDLSRIQSQLQTIAITEKVTLDIQNIRHNLQAWSTPRSELNFIQQAFEQTQTPIQYTGASLAGYVDLAMLHTAFNAPCCCIGATGANRHGADEYVEVESLEKVYQIFLELSKEIYNS